jgi:hypothetical protein
MPAFKLSVFAVPKSVNLDLPVGQTYWLNPETIFFLQ